MTASLSSPLHAKLIFNPVSGSPAQAAGQLLTLIQELQAYRIIPEVHLVQPDEDLSAVAWQAARQKYDLVIACGGDGTVDTIASGMVGSRTPLGIIPAGTQNNVAFSLGIPDDIPSAVALLRQGSLLKADLGHVLCGEKQRFFLEACSIGLLSALFPAADEIQKGNLTRIGDLLATLVSFPLAKFHLLIDKRHNLDVQGHMILISNMPYIGPHYQLSTDISCTDYALDVLVFANLNKLDLIGYAVQAVGGGPKDPRILHFRVRSIDIQTDPPMPVLVDGFDIGESLVRIHVQRHALTVIAGQSEPSAPPASPAPLNGSGASQAN